MPPARASSTASRPTARSSASVTIWTLDLAQASDDGDARLREWLERAEERRPERDPLVGGDEDVDRRLARELPLQFADELQAAADLAQRRERGLQVAGV